MLQRLFPLRVLAGLFFLIICGVAFSEETVGQGVLAQRAAESLRLAAQKFRQAQTENAGSFYSRAHVFEGSARELLAQVQSDDSAGKQVRESTIVQFRQDAGVAAPAFFNLGRALEVNGEYPQAIAAYDNYLRWIDETQRSVFWQGEWLPYVSNRICEGNRLELGCCLGGAPFYRIGSNYLFLAADNDNNTATMQLCRLEDNRKLWEKQLSLISDGVANRRYVVWVGDDCLLFLAGNRLYKLGLADGALLGEASLPLHNMLPNATYFRECLAVEGKEPGTIVISRGGKLLLDGKLSFCQEIMTVDLSSLKMIWHDFGEDRFMPRAWMVGGCVIRKDVESGKLEVIDVRTHDDATARISRELLSLLCFVHCPFGDIYPDGNGGYWLAIAQMDGQGEKHPRAWRIKSWDRPPELDDSVRGISTTSKFQLGSWIFFDKGLTGKEERVSTLFYDRLSGTARIEEIPGSSIETLRSDIDGACSRIVDLWGNTLVAWSDRNSSRIYDLRSLPQLRCSYASPGGSCAMAFLGDKHVWLARQCGNKVQVTKYGISARQQKCNDAEAYARKGVCWQQLGNKDECLSAFRRNLITGDVSPDIMYAISKAFITFGMPQSAWGQAENFFRHAPAGDTRRSELWECVAKANGVVARLPYVRWDKVRIQPEQGRVLTLQSQGLRIDWLGDKGVSWRDESLPKQGRGVLLACGADWATGFRPAEEDNGKSEFVSYDLAAKTSLVQTLDAALKLVPVTFMERSAALKRRYDSLPRLFLNLDDRNQLLLYDPKTLKQVGAFRTPCELAPYVLEGQRFNDSFMSDNYEATLCHVMYDNCCIFVGIPDNYQADPSYVVVCYDYKLDKKVWEKRISFSQRAAGHYAAAHYGLQNRLAAWGDKLFFLANNEDPIVISVKTGEMARTTFDSRSLLLHYPGIIERNSAFADIEANLPLPEFSGQTGDEYELVGYAGDGVLAACNSSKRLFYLHKGGGANAWEAQENSPFPDGLYIDGPYVAAVVDEKSSSMICVCRSNKFFQAGAPAGERTDLVVPCRF